MGGESNDFPQTHFLITFVALLTEGVAQLVRASDCGSEGRGFESHHSPTFKPEA